MEPRTQGVLFFGLLGSIALILGIAVFAGAIRGEWWLGVSGVACGVLSAHMLWRIL